MFACLFALFAGVAPRLALLTLWLFTPLVSRASNTFIAPLLGLIFLPLTTLMYTLSWNPVYGVTGWAWFWVFAGLLLDLMAYSGSGYANRNRARPQPPTCPAGNDRGRTCRSTPAVGERSRPRRGWRSSRGNRPRPS